MKTTKKQTLPRLAAFALAGVLALPALQNLARADGAFDVPGLGTQLLPAQQLAPLHVSADTSKERLDLLVAQCGGLTVEEKNRKFREAIVSIVQASHGNKEASELLMRAVLVQGLALTFGVPNESGTGLAVRGALDTPQGRMYPGVAMTILSDSIELARGFYIDDRKAVAEGTLGDLPYMRLARDRLNKARDRWLPMLGDDFSAEYDLARAVLFQWYGIATAPDNMSIAANAEEVLKITEVLKQMPARESARAIPARQLEAKTRMMRKWIHWLVDRMNSREM